jgi:carbohydrate-selective porin OprB
MQLSPDLQIVLQPATGADSPVLVFGIRLKTQF